MSTEVYEKAILLHDVFLKLESAEKDITEGNTKDAKISINELKNKYGL